MKARLKRSWEAIRSYIGYIAVGLFVLGALGYFEGPIPYVAHLTDFYLDLRAGLIGIGIMVLIINEMYRRREEKRRWILQMGSPDNAVAIEAARQLRAKHWLFDGYLRGAILRGADLHMADLHSANLRYASLSETNLFGANLSGFDLRGADLREAKISQTDLSGADLRYADLSGAVLSEAILSGAKLSGAKLSGADLIGADLTNASVTIDQLTQATLDETTTMPDGSKYSPPTEEINLTN
jgi:hypothetical protein